jgi:hypothetical protein
MGEGAPQYHARLGVGVIPFLLDGGRVRDGGKG